VVSKVAVLVALSLAVPAVVGAEEHSHKEKKPGLDLRVTPRFAFSPASVMLTGELKGGDDVEELYCPEVEWDWGDGGKSVQEADCDPWRPGMTIQRRYNANHTYPFAGVYRIKMTLRKAGKSLVSQSVSLTVRPGLGDTTPDPGS
jgi:hypothetical protein